MTNQEKMFISLVLKSLQIQEKMQHPSKNTQKPTTRQKQAQKSLK
jgi:hypothetical protein